MSYHDLLKRAKQELPDTVKNHDRFEVPKVKGHIQGNRTIISNFSQISSVFRRTPEHFLKYILKELAAPGEIKPKGVIVGRKVSASLINEKILKYAKEYVICRECGKPDTKLSIEKKITFIKCTACGAKYPVKASV